MFVIHRAFKSSLLRGRHRVPLVTPTWLIPALAPHPPLIRCPAPTTPCWCRTSARNPSKSVRMSSGKASNDGAHHESIHVDEHVAHPPGAIHIHSGLHGAQHQLEHRVKEKASFKLLERIAEQLTGTVEKVGTHAVEHAVEQAASKTTQHALESAVEHATQKTLGAAAQRAVENAAERAADRALGSAAGHTAERALETAAERATERAMSSAADRVVESAAQRAAEGALGSAAGHAAERAVGSAAERATERALGSAAERAAESAAGRAAERTLQSTAGHAAERAVESAAERAAAQTLTVATQRAAEQATERAAERALASAAERAAGSAAERAAERAATVAAERSAEMLGPAVSHAAERAFESAAEKAMESTAERAAGRVVEQFAEREADRTLPTGHAVRINWLASSMQRFTTSLRRTLTGIQRLLGLTPRGPARDVASPGGRLLEAALDKLSSTRVGRALLDRAVLNRALRGASVALPAVGALFVAHLVNKDYQRLMQELPSRRRSTATLFTAALLCDVLDVGCHAVVVTGLVHHHFAMGLHLPHTILHAAEFCSTGVAVVSTFAAVAGEVLSSRHQPPHTQQHPNRAETHEQAGIVEPPGSRDDQGGR